jgi:squalene synthase HpnC
LGNLIQNSLILTKSLESSSWTVESATQWCKNYSLLHYENFNVASVFLPRHLRDEYFVLYAFARYTDQLADELTPVDKDLDVKTYRLSALKDWQKNLSELYAGVPPEHPIFVALKPLLDRSEIEFDLFNDLIVAFIQDQTKSRYSSWADVLSYTHGSANPVGKWILRLHGYSINDLDILSNKICTGLQLVNFIQDVKSDYLDRDRIYLPQDDLKRFNVSPEMLTLSPVQKDVINLIRFEVHRAEVLFSEGRRLLYSVGPDLRRQLILFHGGGRVALNEIKKADYNVFGKQIKVNKFYKLALLIRALRGVSL